MLFSVTLEGALVGVGNDRLGADDAEELLDRLMSRLTERGTPDLAIGAALASGSVEVSLTVEATSFDAALALTRRMVEDAVASDQGTPWRIEWTKVSAHRCALLGA